MKAGMRSHFPNTHTRSRTRTKSNSTTSITTSRKFHQLAICLAVVSMVVIYLSVQPADCAPDGGMGKNRDSGSGSGSGSGNSGRLLRPGLLSNLFRRQTSSGNKANKDNESASSNESAASQSPPGDSEDPASQTELEAQKFMDSLPGSGNQNNAPSSFRERVSESWGVLRDGVSNQFKSLRDNWSETVEDLRDTWTGSSD